MLALAWNSNRHACPLHHRFKPAAVLEHFEATASILLYPCTLLHCCAPSPWIRSAAAEKFCMSCTALNPQAQPQANEMPHDDVTRPECTDASMYGATLVYFLHRLLDFREAELHALASMYGRTAESLKQRKFPQDHDLSPLRVIEPLESQQYESICNRAVMVKGMFEIWGHGTSLAELTQSLKECPWKTKAPWIDKNVSFRFVVEGFGRKIPEEEKLALMDAVTEVCPFEGPISLKQQNVKMWIIIIDTRHNQGLPPEIPYRLVVAREIITSSTRSAASTYSLRKRRYLGPTSMDHELSFVMCNLAKVQKGSFVFDPFADIDIRVIRDGKKDKHGNHCNVYTNFSDYGLRDPLGLLRVDAAHPPWRPAVGAFADAILCDPPYGVRAGGRKVTAKDNSGEPLHAREGYIPSTTAYGLVECLADLLESAARLLVMGGRLCFWLPDFTEDAQASDGDLAHEGSEAGNEFGSDSVAQERHAPKVGSVHRDPHLASNGEKVLQHPCLDIWNNSVQTLSCRYMRRLITMVKVNQFDEQESAEWRKSLEGIQLPIDKLHDVVYEVRQPESNKKGKKARYRGKCQ